MSKNPGQHPPESELLLYLDGELDHGPAESVRRHLDSCWSCRMHAAGLQNAILEFARERERSAIPEPPAPWRDIRGEFRRIQATPRPTLIQRIRMGTLFCGAATAIAAVTWFSLPHEAKQAPRAVIAPPRDVSPPRRPTIAELRKPEPTRELALVRPDADSITRRELAMVAQLHVLKADLGEPIELGRAGDRLTLTASGLGADRTREITVALAEFPDVTLRFVGPKADAGTGFNGPATSTARRSIAFEAEIVQYTGGRQSLQRLVDSLLDASDQVTMYAHARANLDKRFPPPVLSSMTAGDRTLLDRIKADHTSGARQAAHALQKLIDPIFERLAIEALPESSGNLIETALKVDRLLNSAFAGAQSDLSDHDLYAELRGWLTRLVELVG